MKIQRRSMRFSKISLKLTSFVANKYLLNEFIKNVFSYLINLHATFIKTVHVHRLLP